MEIDDLKKTWKMLDTQLEKSELVSNDDLIKLIQQKKDTTRNTINAILGSNKNILIATVVLLFFLIAMRISNGLHLSEPYFWAIIVMLPPALGWSLYTMHYLKQINIEEMPLANVIQRVNRYNYWMSMERVIGAGILLLFALIYIISTEMWNGNTTDQIVIICLWLLAFIAYFWLMNKFTFKRLKKIRQNLNELKELKNEN